MKRTFRLHKDTRRRLAWLVTAMLLWQQVAVAAYACVVPVPASVAVTGLQMPSTMAMSDRCEPMSVTSADPLCSKHCQPDRATQIEVRVASVPLCALTALPPMALSMATVALPTRGALIRFDRQHAPPPDPRWLFCTLLI